jgi:hypothetical protein
VFKEEGNEVRYTVERKIDANMERSIFKQEKGANKRRSNTRKITSCISLDFKLSPCSECCSLYFG